MVPQTYPSVYNTYTNRTEMVVYELTSISGKVRWTDYIPVKMTSSTNAAKDNTTDSDGCIPISPLGSITNKQAFTDYVPIYVDNSATDAWAVSATGYIPYGISSAAIGILKRLGSDAHFYLPGIGTLSGLATANYLDSALTTPATVDNPVGGVVDAIGVINATQGTTAAKPILRQTAGKYSWAFDGGDSLSFGSVPFQMSDDHAVIAGFKTNALGTAQTIFGNRSTSSIAPLAPLVRIEAGGFLNTWWRDDASTLSASTSLASLVAGTTYVGTASKVGTTLKNRLNGVQQSTATKTFGATTLNSASIGASVTTTTLDLLNGSTGPILAIKGTLTDSEMLTLERMVANLTPNAPSF